MRYNPEIEAEALRRTQWNAENTQNPVDQYIPLFADGAETT